MAANVPNSSGIFRFGQHARKLFIDNILNRVTTTYSSELRTQATKKLFYGDSAPFFALIGVSLASGAGVLTKEDELEGVCWEIREAANRLQTSWNYDEVSDTLDTNFSIDKLSIGPAIAKGCAAVVYAASFKNNSTLDNPFEGTTDVATPPSSEHSSPAHRASLNQQSFRPEFITPLQNISRFVHNFGGSVDNVQLFSQTSAASQFQDVLNAQKIDEEREQQKDFKMETTTGAGFSGVSSGTMGLVSILEIYKILA